MRSPCLKESSTMFNFTNVCVSAGSNKNGFLDNSILYHHLLSEVCCAATLVIHSRLCEAISSFSPPASSCFTRTNSDAVQHWSCDSFLNTPLFPAGVISPKHLPCLNTPDAVLMPVFSTMTTWSPDLRCCCSTCCSSCGVSCP